MNRFVFIGLLFIASQSFAQQYYSMVDTNAVWYDEGGGSDFPVWYGTVGYKYFLGDDSIVQSESYKKLFRQKLFSFIHTNSNGAIWTGAYVNESPQLVGALREDSLKKVWFYAFTEFNINLGWWSFEQDSIYQLYDFSLSVGDTLPFTAGGYPLFVTSIDSITLINGEPRRRHVLSYNVYCIEGIGATNNIFGPRFWCSLDCSSVLKCYIHNDTLLYKTPEYPNIACDSTFQYGVNVSFNETKESSFIKLSPNPAFNYINIYYSSQAQTTSQLQFTDLLGRNLYATEIMSGETLRLPTTLFNNNHIVFCRLNQNNYSVVKKILIE
jgi:hypothetical protein